MTVGDRQLTSKVQEATN